MTPRPRLFVASWDETLLRTRTMMLGAYFSVQSASRFSEAIRLLCNNPYDLVVLCHTLDDKQQETLAMLARAYYSPVQVLALQTQPAPDKPYADHLYEITRGPWQLVTKCAQIVGYIIKSRARHVA